MCYVRNPITKYYTMEPHMQLTVLWSKPIVVCLLQVGWAQPVEGGVISGSQLTPGATLTFTLPAYLSSINNMVRSHPTW